MSVFSEVVNIFTLIKDQFMEKYIYCFSPIFQEPNLQILELIKNTHLQVLELIIFIVGFIQIHLAVKEKPIAWLLVVFNCTLLMYVWGSKGVIGQVALYGYLLVNAILAFMGWKKRDQNNNFIVRVKRNKFYISLIQIPLLCILIFAVVNIIKFLKVHYGLVSNNTLRDICILVFTIYAFTLQRHKYIESWFYLTIIDINVVLFYIDLGLYMLAVVRGYITIITIYGVFKWTKKYLKERKQPQPQ